MAERPDRHPWLDLLDVDGPFLSRPALDDVYDEAWPPRISNEHREILELPTTLSAEWDETAMAAVRAGVEAVVILDGRRPHAMLVELFTEHGAGTLVRAR